MPPVLDPVNSKVDGLAFLGLSLARNHYYGRGEGKDGEEGKAAANDEGYNKEGEKLGHPDSYTHQVAFDLNQVIDREYKYIQATDDNGWLVGGGEAGPPTSYKLALLDSAHVEIMRIGTYRKDWGGLDREELLKVMASGSILIPQIEALPTDVVPNPDKPPELEIRFDMKEISPTASQLTNLEKGDFEAFCKEPLPINWQLRFLHNQFFKTFIFPSRFCPGAFHSTILRKADFRSEDHKVAYFQKCAIALANWRREGPKALNTIPRHLDTTPLTREERKANQAAQYAEEGLEKFGAAIARRDSNDTDFAEPTEEEEEAVAELVDKLAAMAPLPPAATTAKATANLEVSLDEGSSFEDEEEGDVEPKEEEEATEEAPEAEAPEATVPEPADDNAESAEAEPSAEAEAVNDEAPEEAVTELVPTATTGEITEAVSEAPTDEACAEDLSTTGESNANPPPLPNRQPTAPEDCHSGIWLFTDRANITHFFAPNFLPPYDTPEKRKIIFDVLREEWDEKSLSWKTCGHGSMTKKKEIVTKDGNVIDMIGGAVSSVIDGFCSK
eukprot:CAMPEP_0116129984 /NCGR_PEP_ID=MMETSP0329-20121206/8215_1 /TAXON_ID=697910 /ORGANISM="Pseudo-nitzschia arenysensis, Strain B593" /LENGTH=556 /DNA_ID=CAMNT_0003624287 /DNA_START=85 /DNA_END=1755 /DNA_ORIENTATION=-